MTYNARGRMLKLINFLKVYLKNKSCVHWIKYIKRYLPSDTTGFIPMTANCNIFVSKMVAKQISIGGIWTSYWIGEMDMTQLRPLPVVLIHNQHKYILIPIFLTIKCFRITQICFIHILVLSFWKFFRSKYRNFANLRTFIALPPDSIQFN